MEDKGGYCNFDEIVKLLDKLDKNTRDHALISGLAYSGRRVGEIRLLRPMDFLIDKTAIWWYIEKKRGPKKPRVSIPIAPKCYLALQEYISRRKIRPENYVYHGWECFNDRPLSRVHIWREVKRICEEHNLRTVSGLIPSVHTFRHSFAIHVLNRDNSGRTIRTLQFLLQHEDIRTTMFYLQFVRSEYADQVDKIFSNNPELLESL